MSDYETRAIVIDGDMSNEDSDKALDALEMFEMAISKINTVDDAREFIENLKKLEKLLKAADLWHEKASEYLVMEAEAYCRIAELGLGDSIPHKSIKYKTVMWLSEMDPSERRSYVDECYEGISILKLYEKVVVVPERMTYDYTRLHRYRDDIVDEYEKNGVVSLSKYEHQLDLARKSLSADIVKGYKDEVRDRLRKMGAHGLGDDLGTYVSTWNAKRSISEVIGNKVDSIMRDIGRLRSILAEDGDDVEIRLPIRSETNFTRELSDESAVNAMLVICGLGEPDYGERSEVSKAKLVSNILSKFGYTPVSLVKCLYGHSVQAFEASGMDTSFANVDMREYGWDDGDAA